MGHSAKSNGADEAGFTLIELLAVISILGIISFALTEAVILGLKTTDATANDSFRSAGVQALQSFFTSDAQSATLVSTADPAPQCAPAAATPRVFLHLSWNDQGKARDVSYSLEDDIPAVAGQSEVVRWSCSGDGAPDKRMLGRLNYDSAVAPELAQCRPVACQAMPSRFDTITLKVPTDRPEEVTNPSGPVPPAAVEMTVRRRTT